MLFIALGAIGKTVSGSERFHIAGMYSIFRALRRYIAFN